MMSNEIYKNEHFFHKCTFCKVFKADDKTPSGSMFHSHEFVQIWYIRQGRCDHFVGEQVYHLEVGDSFIILPHVTHKTLLQPNTNVICCDFDPTVVLAASALGEDKMSDLTLEKVRAFLNASGAELLCFRFQQKIRRRVEHLMQELLDEYEDGSHYFEDVLRIKIQELLLLFMRESALVPEHIRADQIYEKYKVLMADAIRYIDENYCENLTLGGVCKHFAISRTYFCHLCKLITGKTFTEYLTDLRIRAAMTLLEDQSLSISEVSERLGFSNTSYFSKIFKKYTGCLPKEYRKKRVNRTDLHAE